MLKIPRKGKENIKFIFNSTHWAFFHIYIFFSLDFYYILYSTLEKGNVSYHRLNILFWSQIYPLNLMLMWKIWTNIN